MTKKEVYEDIEQMFGIVPSFMRNVPESTVELEWNLFKKVAIEESKIPSKYKELMGLAIASVTKCKYCTYFHTELAKLFGATDEEIEETVHFAKNTAGWSAYINGLQIDYDEFKNETDQACDHVRSIEKSTAQAY